MSKEIKLEHDSLQPGTADSIIGLDVSTTP
jgi:hypothetical protein